MANHKRGKSKRNVRCTLCTKHRWLGNSKDRRKAKERSSDEYARKEMKASRNREA